MTDIKVGDRVRVSPETEGIVLATGDEYAWVRIDHCGVPVTSILDCLTPIPDTVTPTLLREDAEWLVENIEFDHIAGGSYDRIIAALKEVL